MRNLSEFVENAVPIDPRREQILQLFQDEWHHKYAIFEDKTTGNRRLFFRRAIGTGANYDRWRELNIISEINEDLTS